METHKLIHTEPAMEHHLTGEQKNTTTAEVSGWIERASILMNLLVLALSFALMGAFWFANITPLFLFLFGLPILALLSFFVIYKSGLIHKTYKTTGKALVCIIILGILLSGGFYLRYPTSAHIHGGLDQGSYFNIAAWMARHGTYDRQDKILSDAFNQNWPFAFNLVGNPYYTSKGRPQKLITGEYEGERFLGGFTIKDRKKGEVVPQFYPLTPLVLTASHWLFGARGTGNILPIFGILSVLSAALLTYRIWKSSFVSGLVFITLLVSGLEVFFSAFPVSEIISQYFIISGIWLLLWSMDDHRYSLPLLAGLNFTAALFNHVSAIFYLVPVAFFFILHRMTCQDRAEHRSIFIFYYTFLAGAAASLISARIYNGYYVYRNFKENLSFLEPLQINGTFLILFSSVFIAALLPFLFSISPGKHLREKPLWSKRILVVMTGFIALLIIAKTSLSTFDLISLGEIRYTYFSSITSHISPLGWFFLLWGVFFAIFASKIRLVMLPLITLLLPSFLFLFFVFKTHYQWYYARYYVKEFYPLAIIFIAYGIYRFSHLRMLKGITGKVVAISLGILLVLYSAYPNFYFFKRPFLHGAYKHMLTLNSKLKARSIIFLVQGHDKYILPDSEKRLTVPLVYSFDHDVIWLPLRNELPQIAGIVRHYLDIYHRPIYLIYISGQPLPRHLLPVGAKLLFSQLHTFTEQESVYHIPKKQWNLKIGLHLYEL